MSKLVVYKASAGSGKTFTLAVSYIKLLVINTRTYREVLAVTFTNKATAEMKERIISQLYGIWKGDKDSEAYLTVLKEKLDQDYPNEYTTQKIQERCGEALIFMLHDYNHFKVTTIDSFFQSVMRNLARELELSPNLNIELNSTDVINEAVDSMIEHLTPKSPALLWLLEYIQEKITDNKSWNVARELKPFAKNILEEEYLERGDGLREKLKNPQLIPQYKREISEMEREALEQMKGFYEQFEGEAESCGLTPDSFKGSSKGIGSYFRKLYRGELDDKVRNKTVESCLEAPENWTAKNSIDRDTIINLAASSLMELLQTAEKFRTKNNFIVNSCRLSKAHLNKLQLLAKIDGEMRLKNRELNRFLLSDTNALLQRIIDEGDSSFIFEKIGANIRNIMIDEFQDTSRLQWQNFRILLLEGLAQGADSLIVGDVKQSIYRWRGGDWSILNKLGDQIRTFEQFPIQKETLDTNRRSESNIIHFNNLLFPILVNALDETYREEVKEACLPLLNAYSDVKQLSPKREKRGYIKLQSLSASNKEEYLQATLIALGEEIESLINHGVAESDIAILVRKKQSIPDIADFFNKNYGITIISDEAFRLDASTAVNTLINALRLLSNPTDDIVKAELVLTYQKNILGRMEPNDFYLLQQEKDQFLPTVFFNQADILRELPLYELLEKLFALFELDRIEQQDAYLFSFFDKVMSYLESKSSLLDDFITYWDEQMSSETIPSGEVEGVRILSIHKSKGLEFHTVLLPFADWPIETDRHDHLVWCQTSYEPFNKLDLIPINYGTAMQQSLYRQNYLDEQLQLWVDNLNILYVALTRAGSNLFIYTKEGDKKGISSLINRAIPLIAEAQECTWLVDTPYEYGEISPSKSILEEKKTNLFEQLPAKESVKMETFKHNFDFRQSNKSADFIAGVDDEESPYRFINRGMLLHELFSSIKNRDDIKPAISKLMFDGLIVDQEEAQAIEEFTQEAISAPEISEWYDQSWQLFNECSIIYNVDGRVETRRPDRVMVNKEGTRTVVVDFKFGKKNKLHIGQVKEYMELLDKMGYPHIEGYLWYVTNKSVERI